MAGSKLKNVTGACSVPGKIPGCKISDDDDRSGVASTVFGEEKMMGWLDCCPLEDKAIAPVAMTSNNRLSFGGRNSIISMIR